MKVIATVLFTLTGVVVLWAVWASLNRSPRTVDTTVKEESSAREEKEEKPACVPSQHPTAPPLPPPAPVAFVPAANEKVSAAMGETVVKNLIANVRVAAAKGDDATRKILLNGLKKDASTARRLLQIEISSATDPAIKSVLNDILDDLKGEAR